MRWCKGINELFSGTQIITNFHNGTYVKDSLTRGLAQPDELMVAQLFPVPRRVENLFWITLFCLAKEIPWCLLSKKFQAGRIPTVEAASLLLAVDWVMVMVPRRKLARPTAPAYPWPAMAKAIWRTDQDQHRSLRSVKLLPVGTLLQNRHFFEQNCGGVPHSIKNNFIKKEKAKAKDQSVLQNV